MRIIIALVVLSVASASRERLLRSEQCGPNETSCPAGCCPEANWYCCPDNIYCAATAADCPFIAKKERLMKMAAKKQCGTYETLCPAGCCQNANWYCCPDNIYCAATAADCSISNPNFYITPTYPPTTTFNPYSTTSCPSTTFSTTTTPTCPDISKAVFFFHYTGEIFLPRSCVMISSRERLLERRPGPV